ncbi:MAG: xanthine dehydrogenase molybdopterin binding subunit [Xanthomonadales bacterium]|nr:xanthine dehydrogenase molybdopterin binding subunit [Xanthomonadales bacterium]
MKIKSSPHDSARSHVSGRSEFIDDRPRQQGELHVEVLYSTVACGNIDKLDFNEALELPGVVAIFTYKDLEQNLWGSIVKDQPILAEQQVNYVGEPIAVIAAENQAIAIAAKKLIILDISTKAAVLNLQQARQQQSVMGKTYKLSCGDSQAAIDSAENLITGTFISGGQDHFYLESQACIAYPEENQCLQIHSSAQHPTEVQHVVASALGLQQHQLVCVVKRMGGGFGGKESQSAHYAALAALVALKTQKPARLCLSKDDDMIATGKRHPFQSDYKAAFDKHGRLLALEVDLYADGGAYLDLSPAILQRAMFHVDNAYYLANATINGTICKTNTQPHTAFRGFGGPQGAAIIEHILEEIAQSLGVDALAVRKLNCYQGESISTHYGQLVENNVLPELFAQIESSSNYQQRRKGITEYNKQSGILVKGMALTAVKFGISFTTRFLNQGNALVNIHLDGSIQVSTGATEMGQGVNSKIRGVVSEAFGIDVEDVRMMPTSTEKNANTSATAASSGSDINCAAALIACEKIATRLANLAAQSWTAVEAGEEYEVNPEIDINNIVFAGGQVFDKGDANKTIPFSKLVKTAYLNRISLSDYGYFKTPKIHFDYVTTKGRPFLYYTNGVAVSEVSVDKYTGEVKILQTDILMDLGRLLNEGIDYGQTAGGFIQGAGWVTTEKLFYDDGGKLISHSPTTYKIPNIQDTPRVFNIDFLENNSNTINVRASKAVGEPPLLLGLSVWAAIKNAIHNAGVDDTSKLQIPATNEEVIRILGNAS